MVQISCPSLTTATNTHPSRTFSLFLHNASTEQKCSPMPGFLPLAYLLYLTVTAPELRGILLLFTWIQKRIESIEAHAHRFTFSSIGLAEEQVKLPTLHSVPPCLLRKKSPQTAQNPLYSCTGNVHFSASITTCEHDIGEVDPPSAFNTEMSQVKTYLEEPLSQTDINRDLNC